MNRITDIDELINTLDTLLTNKQFDKNLIDEYIFSYIYFDDITSYRLPKCFMEIMNKHSLSISNIDNYIDKLLPHNVVIYLALLNNTNNMQYWQYFLNKINKSINNEQQYLSIYNVYAKGFNKAFKKIINDSNIIYYLLFNIFNNSIVNKLCTICKNHSQLNEKDIYFLQQKQMLDLLYIYVKDIFSLHGDYLLDQCCRMKMDMIYYYIYFHPFISDSIIRKVFHKIKKWYKSESLYHYFCQYILYNQLSDEHKVQLNSILLLNKL